MKSHLNAWIAGDGNEETSTQNNENTTPFNLKISPELEELVGPERRYTLAFFQDALPAMTNNQLAVHGIELEKDVFGVRVIGMIRNGLDASVELDKIPLTLRDASGEAVARHVFHMEEKEEIPPRTALVTTWVFPYPSFIKKEVDFSDWEIVFSSR